MKKIVTVLLSLGLGSSLYAQAPKIPGKPARPQEKKQAGVTPAIPPVPKVTPKVVPPPSAKPGHASTPKNPAAPGMRQRGLPQPAGNAASRPSKTIPEALACPDGQSIDGRNWEDQDVADRYSQYTGKRVLLSSATQNLEIRFFQRGPLTNREAADLLVKVLDMEGYVFVPSGANEVKLLPKAQGTGSNGPAELEGIIDDPNDIPQGDNYISYFMKLGFIKPEEALRTFTQSIHGLGPGAKIAPVPNASAVLITGKAAFIRKLINQKRYIDVPTGNVDTTWVQLNYADAEEVATTLNEIMNAQQQRKTTAGVTTPSVTTSGGSSRKSNRPPGVPVAANGVSTSAAGEDIPVQIVASPRLNKLFIMGRPVDIVFVEGLAREFDAPPNRNTFIKRKLRFMIASDFLQVAADALEAHSSNGSAKQGGGGGAVRQGTQNRGQLSRGSGGSSRSGQGGSRAATAESVQEFNVSDVPESMVVGKTFIVADNLANSILVQGPPESLRIVSELIDKLDGRPQQVMISTVFGEISLGDDRDVGVSWGRVSNDGVPRLDSNGNVVRDANGNVIRDSDPSKRRAGAGSIGNTFADLLGLTNISGLRAAASSGLNIYGRVKDVTAMLHALQTYSEFKVLSRPTVYTANNRKAIISSGTRIAVPTNQFNSGATGQSTNIEYRDVLLRFEVVPLINSTEEVTLRISLTNDSVGANQTIGDLTVPTIGTEQISTTVTVPNGSTVVLGGLVTETERNSRSGVPVLSRIPGIGRLFSRKTKDVDRRELLIFIQPRIVSGEASQHKAQADMERRYDVAKPTRDFADGVLPRKLGKRKASPKKVAPKKVAPKKGEGSKGAIPTASARPSYLRYPTRR